MSAKLDIDRFHASLQCGHVSDSTVVEVFALTIREHHEVLVVNMYGVRSFSHWSTTSVPAGASRAGIWV